MTRTLSRNMKTSLTSIKRLRRPVYSSERKWYNDKLQHRREGKTMSQNVIERQSLQRDITTEAMESKYDIIA